MIRYINNRFNSINELLEYYKISKSNIYKLITNKLIKVNDKIVDNKNENIKEKDIIIIDDKKLKNNNYIPSKVKIDILYEDEDILIVYKDRKLLVHPDGNDNDTLLNRVAYYYKDQDIVFEHLHRIDYDTCGMVVFSKNILTHTYLSNLWENGNVEKKYVLWCKGILGKKQGIINKRIGKDRHSNKQIISNTGAYCETIYEVLEEKNGFSKLDVKINGGRRHQIRVHLASINHPIVGDKMYGDEKEEHEMMLKFYKVSFIHPRTFKEFSFEIDKNL